MSWARSPSPCSPSPLRGPYGGSARARPRVHLPPFADRLGFGARPSPCSPTVCLGHPLWPADWWPIPATSGSHAGLLPIPTGLLPIPTGLLPSPRGTVADLDRVSHANRRVKRSKSATVRGEAVRIGNTPRARRERTCCSPAHGRREQVFLDRIESPDAESRFSLRAPRQPSPRAVNPGQKRALEHREQGISSRAVHPGLVFTALERKPCSR